MTGMYENSNGNGNGNHNGNGHRPDLTPDDLRLESSLGRFVREPTVERTTRSRHGRRRLHRQPPRRGSGRGRRRRPRHGPLQRPRRPRRARVDRPCRALRGRRPRGRHPQHRVGGPRGGGPRPRLPSRQPDRGPPFLLRSPHLHRDQHRSAPSTSPRPASRTRSSGWCTPRARRPMAPHSTCRSPRTIPSPPSRRTRPARSARTSSCSASPARLIFARRWCGRSTPTGRASRRAR